MAAAIGAGRIYAEPESSPTGMTPEETSGYIRRHLALAAGRKLVGQAAAPAAISEVISPD